MLIVLERKGSFNLVYELTVSLCWNSLEVKSFLHQLQHLFPLLEPNSKVIAVDLSILY